MTEAAELFQNAGQVQVFNHVAQHAGGRARILAAEGCARALLKLYRRLAAGEFGRLAKDEEAFVTFEMGMCREVHGDLKRAFELFKKVGREYAGTKYGPQGLVYMANAARGVPGERQNAEQYYMEVHNRFPNTQWGMYALYNLGCYFASAEGMQPEKGKEILRFFVRRYPESHLRFAAKEIIDGAWDESVAMMRRVKKEDEEREKRKREGG